MKRILAALLCCLALANCSSGALLRSGTTTPSQATQQSPLSGATPTTLTVWYPWTGRLEQALSTLARAFEQTHPGIRINLEGHPVATMVRDYNAHVADGGAPQLLVVQGRYVGELALSHHVLPVDKALPTTVLQPLLPAAVANAQVGDQHYGVPLVLQALVYLYDRRALPHPPTSLAELWTTTPTTATTESAQPVKLAYHLSLLTALPFLYALNGQLHGVDDGIALSTSNRAVALRWLTGLQNLLAQPEARVSDDLQTVDQALQTGHAASVIDWSYQLPEYTTVWGKDAVGVAPLPPSAAGTPGPPTVVAADVICVNSVISASQRAAAFALIEYLASKEAQTTLAKGTGIIPAHHDAKVDDAAQLFLPTLGQAIAVPTGLDSQGWTALNDMLLSVLNGNASPDQALDRAAAQLREQPR